MVFEKVKNVIIEIMGIPENEILLESHLFDELDADSLDMSQIILELENEYKIDINDDDFSSFETVKDIVDYIQK
ncbi:acyl carrier protein [Lutibacter sp. B2]|nr:acyl carrier protein [Lutibacter sp. B2]